MSKKGLPPRFKPLTAPRAISLQKASKTGKHRGSPRARGYDGRWDGLSIAYRKQHPFCAWCAQDGRDSLVDLVDHIIPVIDRPELRYEWSNLWSLCVFHHGVKAKMETYARENDLLEQLPAWCKDPSQRPRMFGPAVEC